MSVLLAYASLARRREHEHVRVNKTFPGLWHVLAIFFYFRPQILLLDHFEADFKEENESL